MRLIDADFVLSRVKPYSYDDENWAVTGGTVIRLIHNAIDDAPTIDAVPVVRCRECCHRHESEFCECRPDDAFCSDGERKDGEG